MTPDQLEFENVVARTDELLCKAYDASVNQKDCPDVRLRFPIYRDDDLKAGARHRVSEQEARFLMAVELAQSSLLFAVEAPTFRRYQFTKSDGEGRSGQTDVAVYQPDGARRWNVEFKAGGFSANRVGKNNIQKDI